jgi:hypothetical protein
MILWEKASTALPGMSVTDAAGSEKRYYVAAESLLKSMKAGDERLSTDAVTLAQQNFSAEEYEPENEEEDLNLASALIDNILEGLATYRRDLGR